MNIIRYKLHFPYTSIYTLYNIFTEHIQMSSQRKRKRSFLSSYTLYIMKCAYGNMCLLWYSFFSIRWIFNVDTFREKSDTHVLKCVCYKYIRFHFSISSQVDNEQYVCTNPFNQGICCKFSPNTFFSVLPIK